MKIYHQKFIQSSIRTRGFTALELTMSISLVVVVAILLIGPLVSFYRKISFSGKVDSVIALIEEARKNTLSSYNSAQYGMHFETGRVVQFRGTTFTEPDSNNIEIAMNSFIEISPTILNGGGDDLLFDRLTGETATFGTTTISLTLSPSYVRTIVIHQSGLVEIL